MKYFSYCSSEKTISWHTFRRNGNMLETKTVFNFWVSEQIEQEEEEKKRNKNKGNRKSPR